MTVPKQFYGLAGAPVLVHTVRAVSQVAEVGDIVLVVPGEHCGWAEELVAEYSLDKVRGVVAGGRRRQDSVQAGLETVPPSTGLVVVHDGVRPCITPELIGRCIAVARDTGAAMAAVPVKDTLKSVSRDHRVTGTVDREPLWQAQTPQVVRADLLRQAFVEANRLGVTCTDEAALLELIGVFMTVVPGSEKNIKITRPDDLRLAEAFMDKNRADFSPCALRVGHGFDVHRLVEGRSLVLGGVSIPHSLGLLGHSDADVLTHALCDALLGAMGQGDIGRHFPDTDDKYRGINSLYLLEKVVSLASAEGFALVNADITVMAERPRLSGYIPEMEKRLAAVCRVAPEVINCKATTTEKLGFVGREEGIAAQAVVLLVQEKKGGQGVSG